MHSLSISRLLLLSQISSIIPARLEDLVGGTADSSAAVDRGDPPPYPMVEYIENYGACLDSCRFAAMWPAGEAKEIRDARTGCMQETAVRAWTKQ